MQNLYQSALKIAARARLMTAPALTPEQLRRQDDLRRATAPGMVKGGALVTPTARAKVQYRELKRAYAETHRILEGLEAHVYSPESLLIAVANHQRAQHLLTRARRMPRTRLGARARLVALDNASVAYEVLEVLTNRLNRSGAPGGQRAS